MGKKYDISLYDGEDNFLRYYVYNQTEYFDFEVLFEDGEFCGKVVGYICPLEEDSMECEEVLLKSSDPLYIALRDRAIIDNNIWINSIKRSDK